MDVEVASEIRQSLAVIQERLETLIAKQDSITANQKELEGRFITTNRSNDAQHLDIIKQLTRSQALYETMRADVKQLQRYRDNFWIKVLGAATGVSALVASIVGGILFLINSAQ